MFEELNSEPGATPHSLPPAEAGPEGGGQPAELAPAQPEASSPRTSEGEADLEREDAGQELMDWKEALRRDFDIWLDGVAEMPELEDLEGEAGGTPDLCSFYEQLAAATTESRKANRRTAEAISQWGDMLSRFDGSLLPLREVIGQLTAVQPKTGELSRAYCLVLTEWLDRLYRISKAFQSPPRKTSWWASSVPAWRRAWETQQQALVMLVSHLEELLKKEGVTRLETVNGPFDPATMTAVAAEPDPVHPPQTVLEELASGYHRHGELLRPAQVKVSRLP